VDPLSLPVTVWFFTTAFDSTRDFRTGLDDNSMFGHLHKAQMYLDKARETEEKIKVWVA
jgi:hypothetical protein